MRGIIGILLLTVCAWAQDGRPVFQTLRYNEDWTWLAEPSRRTDFFDPVKFVRLDGSNIYVSFGGEVRLKYELYTEPVFNQQPADDNGFLLQRYLLHADFHATPYFRVFGQLQSSLEDGRTGGPRPADKDDLDFHQTFFDARLPWADEDAVTLRAGRQELAYGSQRLISVREAPNNRLAFDAVRMLTELGDWEADAWLGQPVDIDPGFFDDRRIKTTTFWGGYVTGPLSFIPGLRAVLLPWNFAENAAYARGTADELRHSLGACLGGKARGIGIVSLLASLVHLATMASSRGRRHRIPVGLSPARRCNRVCSCGRTLPAAITTGQISARSIRCSHAVLTSTTRRSFGPQNLMDLQPGLIWCLTVGEVVG
ncbi:MAG: alginate export family protein [Verrucomicrobiota bacterium]